MSEKKIYEQSIQRNKFPKNEKLMKEKSSLPV